VCDKLINELNGKWMDGKWIEWMWKVDVESGMSGCGCGKWIVARFRISHIYTGCYKLILLTLSGGSAAAVR